MEASTLESVDTLLTEDLRSGSVQAHPRDDLDHELDRIRYEIEWLRAQNYLIRKQLSLSHENSELKSAAIISEILTWLEDGRRSKEPEDHLGEKALDKFHQTVVPETSAAEKYRSRSLSPGYAKPDSNGRDRSRSASYDRSRDRSGSYDRSRDRSGSYDRSRDHSASSYDRSRDRSGSYDRSRDRLSSNDRSRDRAGVDTAKHVKFEDGGAYVSSADADEEFPIITGSKDGRRGSIAAWYPATPKQKHNSVVEDDPEDLMVSTSGSAIREENRPKHGDYWLPKSRAQIPSESDVYEPPIASSTPAVLNKAEFKGPEYNDASIQHDSVARSDRSTKRMTSMELLNLSIENEKSLADYIEKCKCDPAASAECICRDENMGITRDKTMNGLNSENVAKTSTRLLGEICFQLDRRILNYVFNGREQTDDHRRKRFYGFTLNNIASMIQVEATDVNTGSVDVKAKLAMSYRYQYIFHILKHCGYRMEYHPHFATNMVNKYGLLNYPLGHKTTNLMLQDPTALHAMIEEQAQGNELANMKIMLDCLILLANDDRKPLFIW